MLGLFAAAAEHRTAPWRYVAHRCGGEANLLEYHTHAFSNVVDVDLALAGALPPKIIKVGTTTNLWGGKGQRGREEKSKSG